MEDEMKRELMELGVDVDAAIGRFAGKAERYKKYLAIHIEQDYFSLLMKAIEEKNVEDAQRYSHTLKGDFYNFEFGEIADLMSSANDMFKENYYENACWLVEETREQYMRITEVIRKYIRREMTPTSIGGE